MGHGAEMFSEERLDVYHLVYAMQKPVK